jgi:FKBP-type peptidyl-prolyl cis-trans isomerase FkpA
MKSLYLSLFVVLFMSCNSDDDPITKDYTAENEQEIVDYIEAYGLNPIRTNSGLYYIVDEVGDGAEITETSDVSVRMKVLTIDGTILFEDDIDAISINLQDALSGWIEGFQFFNEGGSGTLILPAHLAYGNSAVNGIPEGSVVIFEFEIVDYVAENEQEIIDYIQENNLEDVLVSGSGLYYLINEQGEGEEPSENSNVTVAYKGYFTDGEVFDQSNTNGASFNLSGVIPGWTEGIRYFNEGGHGLLLVPSHLAYGRYNFQDIPGGSVLIFEVNLKSVN